MPTTYRFLKMQATGNDFLIVDAGQSPAPPKDQRAAIARRYCDRHSGFGADGFLVLENFAWDFYNSDGSAATMCGNAARAVGLLLLDQSQQATVSFATAKGKVQASRGAEGGIRVQFELSSSPLESLPYHSAVLVDTGVPHAVIKSNDLNDTDRMRKTGLDIKARFPDGINVTYYATRSSNSIASTTFERGVEDFTLSCGTGALAAARVHLGGRDGACKVSVPGGDLDVRLEGRQATLTGDARYIGWCTPLEGQV